MLGFRFSENMYGSYRRLSDGAEPRRFRFHVDAVSHNLFRTLRDGKVKATGSVEAEGIAERAPFEGVMVIEPVLRRRIDQVLAIVDEVIAEYNAFEKFPR